MLPAHDIRRLGALHAQHPWCAGAAPSQWPIGQLDKQGRAVRGAPGLRRRILQPIYALNVSVSRQRHRPPPRALALPE